MGRTLSRLNWQGISRTGHFTSMKYRKIPSTDIQISEIGFGAWGIGGRSAGNTSYGETDSNVSRAALSKALELGITFYDTSNMYGNGHSEELLGEVFHRMRDRVVIASKAGIVSMENAESNFSQQHILDSLESSLKRLRTDYIDIFQLHNPHPELPKTSPEIAETLLKLKAEGKIRAIGISTKSPAEAMKMIDVFPCDCIQANFNMLDVRANNCGLLKIAKDKGIGIITRTPLCFGFLSGKVGPDTVFQDGDHRKDWHKEQISRWSQGSQILMKVAQNKTCPNSMAQTALQFCLSFDAVTTVIPGIMTPEEATENAHASDLGDLAPATIEQILEIHRREDFFVPNPDTQSTESVAAEKAV